MKIFANIVNGEIKTISELPINFNNISNFYLLDDEKEEELNILKQNGWFPVKVISDDKEIQEKTEYIIDGEEVKKIITTRDKTQEEITLENSLKKEQKWQEIRYKRNNLLSESDSDVVCDKWEAMTSEEKIKISLYRKELRDLPQKFSNPDDIIWPIKNL